MGSTQSKKDLPQDQEHSVDDQWEEREQNIYKNMSMNTEKLKEFYTVNEIYENLLSTFSEMVNNIKEIKENYLRGVRVVVEN